MKLDHHHKHHLGIYLASLGSAFGLGNFWRFSYVIADHGGGAFVFIFLIMIFFVGLPLLTLELIFGKSTKKGIVAGVSKLMKHSRFKQLGWIAVALCSVILVYYSIIAGWVLHFVVQFFREMILFFLEPKIVMFQDLTDNMLLQFGLASCHILIVATLIYQGFQLNLEKFLAYLTPIMLSILIFLLISVYNLPHRDELVRYLFYPDFSKLPTSAWLASIGQVFFSMSIGFGVMINYSKMSEDQVHLPSLALRITLIDAFVALCAATLIFGIAIGLGYTQLNDPGLLFQVLPPYFFNFEYGTILGFLFFLMLYLVAILASTSLLATIVSNIAEFFKWEKIKALQVTVAYLTFGVVIILVFSFWSKISNLSVLVTIDKFLIHFVMPIVGVGGAWVLQKILPSYELRRFFIDEEKIETLALYREWRILLAWVLPILVIIFLSLYWY